MNTRLMATVAIRQHLRQAYAELGEDLWPIVGRVIQDLMLENQHADNDQLRFDHECGPRA